MEPPGMILLDTDVLVDCLRGSEPARDWLSDHAADNFDVPGIVAMELIAGCRDQASLRNTRAFLNSFRIVWPEAADSARAFELMNAHRLGSALSIPDYLIAAMALNRSARLYTFNAKHFGIIGDLDIQALTSAPDERWFASARMPLSVCSSPDQPVTRLQSRWQILRHYGEFLFSLRSRRMTIRRSQPLDFHPAGAAA
jgi:predicted nucleic acid-binding protein